VWCVCMWVSVCVCVCRSVMSKCMYESFISRTVAEHAMCV